MVTASRAPSASATVFTAERASGSPPLAKCPSATAKRIPAIPRESSRRQGSAGRRLATGSATSGPWSASNAAARSRAERASGPTWSKLPAKSAVPARETRPYVGLSPNTPQSDAGTRIEPLVSEPSVSGTNPAPTAAPDPPEEPPATRSRSCGLRVGP